MQNLREIYSLDNVRRLWLDVRSVPGRTEGRQHDDEEWYSLGLYLLALGTHQRLIYPFSVEKGESPDFILTWQSGETAGLEVTRASEQWLQQAMTAGEKEFQRREEKARAAGTESILLPNQEGVLVRPKAEAEPVSIPLPQEGWLNDRAVTEWCALICGAIEKKLMALPHYRFATHHHLLINDDTLIPVDRRRALKALRPQIPPQTDGEQTGFRTVSLLMSPALAYDVGDESTLLDAGGLLNES